MKWLCRCYHYKTFVGQDNPPLCVFFFFSIKVEDSAKKREKAVTVTIITLSLWELWTWRIAIRALASQGHCSATNLFQWEWLHCYRWIQTASFPHTRKRKAKPFMTTRSPNKLLTERVASRIFLFFLVAPQKKKTTTSEKRKRTYTVKRSPHVQNKQTHKWTSMCFFFFFNTQNNWKKASR